MNIGARGNTDRANNTRVAYARLHAAVLTPTQIDAEAVSATPVITANLWASWPLTVHTDLTDHSGNGRDFTAVGTLSTEADPSDVVALPAPTVSSIARTEEHTSELPSLMRIPYAVFCLQNKQQ